MKISTSELLEWLPHRPPMVWIDEVLSFGAQGGECLIHLKKDAHYFDSEHLRATSLVEFIAQAQAFISICYRQKQNPGIPAHREAFLVAISDAIFEDIKKFPEISDNPILLVRVGPSRRLGHITIFSGSVWSSKNRCLGSANIKAYSN